MARLDVGLLERVAEALDARLYVELRWNGEQLDRLLDEEHAALVETLLNRLRSRGWIAAPEVSFSIYGERGSIDIFALHPTTGCCLVVEVKSAIPDVQAMLSTLDRKRRLAPKIGRGRGWRVSSASAMLALADTSTTRRAVATHSETFAVAFPVRAPDMRRWLRAPSGPVSGLLFLSPTQGARTRARAGARGGARTPKPRSWADPGQPMSAPIRDRDAPGA